MGMLDALKITRLPAEPDAPLLPKINLRLAMDAAEKTVPAHRIAQFPVDGLLTVLRKANAEVALAKDALKEARETVAIERSRQEQELKNLETNVERAMAEHRSQQRKLFAQLGNSGAFEGIDDLAAFLATVETQEAE